ncbi:TPA: ImmA/IrrE family metallo-endopeptidase [Vibrio alginolyticus]|uniref:XRE family transcriptional regulator n=1 Tax=Vibrio alginolyticus TaxID=663 RepID=UPI00102DB349|nr:XRE family transcriptional regulator [Vibrio alginolyticus]EGR0711324.1 ImmA/IrrE family metallo-endopeptidase [Vibrio alginolyticus]RZV20028.1 ImmA/IrrE family metallo-endopeptidase [Vibrio alginolyticus]HBK5921550.1 ImmA/IrrE family metallo-endopeptidase [Vibrio alginolyticus]HBK6034446.1 ImmA/IrrE family metallo-endopeptidase [Vibrio alginolyticus]
MATQALVNPEILSWARIRAGLSEVMLAKKLKVQSDKILNWEAGTLKPTFKQAQNIAKVTHIPFGYLYLPKPPVEKLPIPDLRTLDSAELDAPSPALRETLQLTMKKQDWFKEYLKDRNEEPLKFVGSLSIKSDVKEAVKLIRETLGAAQPQTGDWEEYQRTLIDKIESIGVIVLRSGIVGNNTHRKLSVNEFRGFAICDEYAPVIFINSADAPTARLFTLIHELAHLWIGQSGVSNTITATSHRHEEMFCNAVAGEFLVPEELLKSSWNAEFKLEDNIRKIATATHVSKFVVIRRALDCHLVDRETYNRFYLNELKEFRKKSTSGSGDYYQNTKAKNSKMLSRAVIGEALSGRMLLRDAGSILGVSPSNLKTYARKIN